MSQGNYAYINGLNLYYEIYGTGQPLILLHGGFGTIGMFANLLSKLAATWQIIGVELHGHGHTTDIDRAMSFERMADDVAALIKHLGFERADVCGYSLGGGVALQCAIREVQEELRVTPIDVQPRGELAFQFVDGLALFVYVFSASDCIGEPQETAEAVPLWTPIEALPFDQMWADDRLWFPHLLNDRSFRGRLLFEDDMMLGHEVTFTTSSES